MSIDIIHKTNIIITQTTPTNCTKGLVMILSAIFFNFINKIYERISSSYMNFFRSYYPNFLSNTTSRETYLAIRPIPPFSSIKYANFTCEAQLIGVYLSYEKRNRFLPASMVGVFKRLGDESTCEGSNGFASVVHLPIRKRKRSQIWLH